MIRKTIVAVLALAALGATALGAFSYYVSPYQFQIARYDTSTTMAPGEQSVWLLMHSGKFFIGYKRHLNAPEPLWRNFVPEYRLFGYNSAVVVVNTIPPVHVRILKVWAPFWAAVLLFASYPIYFVIDRGPLQRRRRRRDGLCLRCGYDLTGNESGVCSECGSTTK